MDAKATIESLIRTFMCLAGILGNNWLAVRSLPNQKSGIRTNEVLFINLAVSNLITNYLVDLPDTLADFAERWFLGETYCCMFLFLADLSETSSIYTTFFISVFWHQKLVGSLKRGGAPVQLDSLRLVGCLLAGSWTVAVIFSVPHSFFVKVEQANESSKCVEFYPNALSRQVNEVFYLTLANVLPAAGIVFASCRIVTTLLQNQRRIQGHDPNSTKETVKDENESNENKNDQRSVTSEHLTISYTASSSSFCPNRGLTGHRSPHTRSSASKPGPNSNSQVRAAKSVVAVASVFLVCWMTHLLLRITSNIHTSSTVVEVASYVAASYTSIIPYIFLYGVKKLSCSCRR